MTGRFACIGFDFESGAGFPAVAERLLTRDSADPGSEGERLRWTGAISGARLVAYALADGSVDCCKPSFATPSALPVRWRGTVPDPTGCRFCLLAEVEVLYGGAPAYSLLVEIEQSHDRRRFPRVGATLLLRIAALAEHFRVWRDVRAYAVSQRDGPPVRSVLALPRLPEAPVLPPSAEAIITGVVARTDRRTNEATGEHFDVITLQTQAGALEVLAPATEHRLEPGNVLQGAFWLIAQLPSAPTSVQGADHS